MVVLAGLGIFFFHEHLPEPARGLARTALLRIGLLPRESVYLGYVEGETTLIAPPEARRLVSRPLRRGDRFSRGQPLFSLDSTLIDAEIAQAEAVWRAAEARLDNLLTGRREVEMEVVRAQRREAEAAVRLAEQDLQRSQTLRERGAGTQLQLDQVTSALGQQRARLESLIAQEAAAALGGRDGEIAAARAQVSEAAAARAHAQRRRAELSPQAPYDGYVENTFYDVGEWVGAGAPVLSLLAPDRIKVRFFVPEEDLARVQIGAVVPLTCSSCPEGLEARISYIAPRSEFTPPVIYSQEMRARLVFLVEAVPTRAAVWLRPGLPVRVARLPDPPIVARLDGPVLASADGHAEPRPDAKVRE